MAMYVFLPKGNDSYAFRQRPELTEWEQIHQPLVPDFSGASVEEIRRCEECSELLAKREEPLTGLIVHNRKRDVSETCDGVFVASRKFKLYCENNNLDGLFFRRLPNDREFFSMDSSIVVEFDAERRQTRFINQCPTCGRFESVVGATPVFLKSGNLVPPNGVARTDLEFGSGDEKGPLLLCGVQAAKSLKRGHLNGVTVVRI